ncbi:hypothetical protein AAKU67_000929 [Oxalobacteraceae bacterium GrIS 2.11]
MKNLNVGSVELATFLARAHHKAEGSQSIVITDGSQSIVITDGSHTGILFGDRASANVVPDRM